MANYFSKVGGKKATFYIVSALIILFSDKLGLAPDTSVQLKELSQWFFAGQGIADGLSNGATSHADL